MPLSEEDLEGLSPRELLRLGADLFNTNQHFEAHEAWEAVWLDSPRELRWFYQGLIQVAAAFVHLKRFEYPGTVKLIDEGTAKLDRYGADFLGLHVDRLVLEARTVRDRVVALGERRLREMDVSALPALAFTPQAVPKQQDGLHWLEWAIGQSGNLASPENGTRDIVLVHEPGFVASLWEPVAWRLAEAGYRVLAPSLPGHDGASTLDAEAEVERLRAWLAAVAPHPAAVVGASTGSAIASILASGTGALELRLASNEGADAIENRRWAGLAEMFEALRKRAPFDRWRLDVLWRYVEDGSRSIDDAVELSCAPAVRQSWLNLDAPAGGAVRVDASPWSDPAAAVAALVDTFVTRLIGTLIDYGPARLRLHRGAAYTAFVTTATIAREANSGL